MNTPKKIFFISGNQGKLNNVRLFLQNYNFTIESCDLDLPEVQDLDPKKIIAAKIKNALEYHHHFSTDGALLVDDTSLYLDALAQNNGEVGLPGPFIKWFQEVLGLQGIYDLARRYNNFKAHGIVLLAYVALNDPETIIFAQGKVSGTIVAPQGHDFGWNAIFIPEGYSKTYAQMTSEEQARANIRALALQDLITKLDLQ